MNACAVGEYAHYAPEAKSMVIDTTNRRILCNIGKGSIPQEHSLVIDTNRNGCIEIRVVLNHK